MDCMTNIMKVAVNYAIMVIVSRLVKWAVFVSCSKQATTKEVANCSWKIELDIRNFRRTLWAIACCCSKRSFDNIWCGALGWGSQWQWLGICKMMAKPRESTWSLICIWGRFAKGINKSGPRWYFLHSCIITRRCPSQRKNTIVLVLWARGCVDKRLIR